MKALNGYIILKPKEEESVTTSGLIIQRKEKKYTQEGTVVSVGFDVKGVSVGDLLLYRNLQPIECTIDGELLFVIDSYSVFVNMTAE
jgi:co-chaperonin GroES (HSP10)